MEEGERPAAGGDAHGLLLSLEVRPERIPDLHVVLPRLDVLFEPGKRLTRRLGALLEMALKLDHAIDRASHAGRIGRESEDLSDAGGIPHLHLSRPRVLEVDTAEVLAPAPSVSRSRESQRAVHPCSIPAGRTESCRAARRRW